MRVEVVAGVELYALLFVGSASLAVSCTYDFDAPFAGTSTSTSTSTGPSTTGAGGEGASSSSSVTGTTTGSTTGGGEGGEGPTGELCTNGVDDDANGAVDCANPTCTSVGYTCAPAAPAGFSGPVALLRGGPGEALTCGGAFPEERVAGGIGDLIADAATCTACECSAPQGTCTATLTWFSGAGCGTELGSTVVMSSGCVDDPDVSVGSARGDVPTVTQGTCTPSGGAPASAPATFETSAKLCGAAQGAGCDGGVCTLQAEAPFDTGLCVYQDGATSCDGAGPYTALFEMHAGVDDQRGCSGCGCGDASGATCGGSTTIYRNNDNCNGQGVVLPHDGSCLSAVAIKSHTTSLAESGGSCPPSGGEPLGDAFPTDPITVCCLP